MQLLEGNRTGILISSPELIQQYKEFEERGEPMEAAFMFGVVPAVVLASQISTHLFHTDKLEVASSLLHQPLDVVQCKTVDLEVLAEAEVVFEGRILPGIREPEGPFGELGGYYGPRTEQPVVEISAVTHRNRPIWQTILPASYEEKLPMAISREIALLSSVRQVVPGVKDVHITMGGVGRYHAVIQIRKVQEGDGKTALLAALPATKTSSMLWSSMMTLTCLIRWMWNGPLPPACRPISICSSSRAPKVHRWNRHIICAGYLPKWASTPPARSHTKSSTGEHIFQDRMKSGWRTMYNRGFFIKHGLTKLKLMLPK